ncbi:hypothetical protein Ancab_015564 [Ancistrocladus abbreviatus]
MFLCVGQSYRPGRIILSISSFGIFTVSSFHLLAPHPWTSVLSEGAQLFPETRILCCLDFRNSRNMANRNAHPTRTRSDPTPSSESELSHQLSSVRNLSLDLYQTLINDLKNHTSETWESSTIRDNTITENANGSSSSNVNGASIPNGNNNQANDKDFQKLMGDLNYLKDSFMKFDNLATNQFTKFDDHAKRQIKEIQKQIREILSRRETTRAQHEKLVDSVEELRKQLLSLISKQSAQSTEPNSSAHHSNRARSSMDESCIHESDSLQETSVFAEFLRRYENLGDEETKQCLLCLSVFPGDVEIKKRVLIYMWLGMELITVPEGMTMEDVGNRIFEKFLERGFLEPVIEDGRVSNSCKLHNHHHSLVIALARKLFESDDEGYLAPDFSQLKTHLLNIISSLKQLKGSENLESIKTLFNVDEEKLNFKLDWFSKMKQAKVLHLGRWSAEAKRHIEVESTDFMGGLKNMEQLKHLSLQGISRITEIPDEISKCKDLRILDLRACHNLERIGKGIRSLKLLTHLDVSQCYLLEHLPKEITSLSALRVLKGFVVVDLINNEKSCQFSDLSKLVNLRKLNVSTRCMEFPADEDLKTFRKLKQLRKLTIEWGGSARDSADEASTNGNPSGQPKKSFHFPGWGGIFSRKKENADKDPEAGLPEKLEKLDLRSVPQAAARTLLIPDKLKHLKKLYIRGGGVYDIGQGKKSWQVAEELEKIHLKFLSKLHMDWREFKASFPSVTYLQIVECPRLAFFPCSNEHGVWTKSA